MGTATTLDESAYESLDESTRGDVLQPGDAGYEAARTVWNGMVDKHPSAIARCTGVADVIASVNVAREHDLEVAVKGGGHNVAGKSVCDDGLLIDLGEMNSVRVDPDSQTARVGPGATWGDVDHETQAFGLATTGGLDSRTGVAGLTLGGGQGYLARSYGLSADNLLAADVVTADGELVRASEAEHSDLFWGLRGGSGNFGIVTSFEFDLHEVGPEVLTAQVFHPYEDAARVLDFYREFTADAPREVACYALLVNVPPEAPFPEEYHGETAVALVACHSGDVEDAEGDLAPLGEFGDPILSAIQPMPYTTLQQSFDDGTPDGERYYFKAHYLDDLTDGAIETIIDHTDPLPGPFSMIGLEPMGGAINDVDPDATAFPHRSAAYSFGIWAGWSDPDRDEELVDWTRELHVAMSEYANGGVYSNYLDRDEGDRMQEAYRDNYERLVDLKRDWDPENVFGSHLEPNP